MGVETILYAMCGATDLLLQGIAFNTEGIDNFMESVIGIGADDFVSKMEGFAVQGIQGKHTHPLCKNVDNGMPFRCGKKSPATSLTTSWRDSRNIKP